MEARLTNFAEHEAECDAAFAQLLRQFRLRAGLSQATLAERAGLAEAAVAALERGRRRSPYAQTLGALAEAMNLDNDERAAFVAAARRTQVRVIADADQRCPPSNAPSPRTILIGRDRELQRVHDLLTAEQTDTRLVSVTGVGGVGKTSLALQVAHSCRAVFTDGVWLVELASVTQPAMVDRVVAEALGAFETSVRSPAEAVRTFLRSKRALLVLDNCEQVLEACARLVEVVLDGCPGVRVLTTSREPLLLRGEQQVRLAPLAVTARPEAPQRLPVESPAVQLFVARAQNVAPEFTLNPSIRQAVVDLCARLDGLPLALELAAAYVRILAPQQILARLDDSGELPVGANRLAPTRHQTLRAAMDWSYALLSPAERAVFGRLSIFVGSFDLEAAERVCVGSELAGEEVLGILAGLVDKSLVVALHTTDHTARYRLLEPVRQYANHKLAAAGEATDTHRNHASVYLQLAERAAPELSGSAQVAWLERLEADLPNLRSAMDWLRQHGDGSEFLRLALALVPFWEVRGYLAEGREWLELAQQRSSLAPQVRVQALLGLGRVAFWQVDLNYAAAVLQGAQALARSQDDQPSVTLATTWLGAVRRRQARYAEAQALLEQSLRQHEVRVEAAPAAWALFNLGQIANRDGATAESTRLNEEALRRYRALGNVRLAAMVSVLLACDLVFLGQLEQVPRLLEEGLDVLEATSDRVFLTTGLLTLASIAAHVGESERSARLLGAVAAINASQGLTLPPNARDYYAQLESTASREALEVGRRMAFAQALAEVREMVPLIRDHLNQALPTTPAGEALTQRERSVVRLLVRGRSDREIASELSIAPRTAGVHVRNVLGKLGLRSRWQVHDLPNSMLAGYVNDVLTAN
jgi:non-specific serine/threonine protein kinase